MEKRISRREFGKLAAVASAAAISPGLLAKPNGADDVSDLEAKLAAPFSEEARKIAAESLAAVERAAERRLKHKLPENSEPVTVFIPRRGKDG